MTTRIHRIVTFLLLSTAVLCSQDKQQINEKRTNSENHSRAVKSTENPVLRNMRITETTLTKEGEFLVGVPFLCDGSGNIYVNRYDSTKRYGAGDILKFTPQGEVLVRFSNSQSELAPSKFFVAEDGTVFEMSATVQKPEGAKNWQPDIYIVRYDRNGTFDRKFKLDEQFRPVGSFVVFPTGEILVSALENLMEGERSFPSTPFLGLFGSSGQLIKRISLEADKDITKAIEEGDESKVPKSGPSPNPPVSRGMSVIGSDGNAYLLRRTIPAAVHVISSNGEVIRTLKLDPGDVPIVPLMMQEHSGRLAVLFRNDSNSDVDVTRVRIFNARTGEVQENIAVDHEIGSGMACFDPPQFTFLRMRREDKKFVVLRTSAN